MIQQVTDLLLQTRVEVIQDFGVALAILLVGFILFGYYTKTPVFYLMAAAILIFFAITYADFPALFIAFIAGFIFMVLFTFLQIRGND